MTDDLNALADWLLACGVDTVALESTGVYWIPVYEVLEQRGLKVWLVDARQMKYVPGRKSDVQDCQWLQKLMSLGLLRAAWRPGGDGVRGAGRGAPARGAARRAGQLGAAHAKGAGADEHPAHRGPQRRDGADGPGDHPRHRGRPARCARCWRGTATAASRPAPRTMPRALTGNWRDEHLFVLGQALAMYEDIAQRLASAMPSCKRCWPTAADARGRSGPAPAKRGQQEHAGVRRAPALANWAGVDLTRINGLGVTW